MAKWQYRHTIEGGGTETVTVSGTQYQSVTSVQEYATVQSKPIDGGTTLPGTSLVKLDDDNPVDLLSVDTNGNLVVSGQANALSGNASNSVLTLSQSSNTTLYPGQGMKIGVNSSNELEAQTLNSSNDERPTIWANGSHVNNGNGEYVFRGLINNVKELYNSSTTHYLTPLTSGITNIYWDIENERFTTVDSGWPKCGEFDYTGMSYILTSTTSIPWTANISIDSDSEVNSIKNKTILTPSSGGTFRHFVLNDPNGTNSYDDLWQTGDRVAIVWQGGSNYFGTVSVTGSVELLNPDGNAYSSNIYVQTSASSSDKAVLLEVIDDSGTQKWQIISEDKDIVETDVYVDYHVMKNSLDETPIIKETSDDTWQQLGMDNDGILTTKEIGGNKFRYLHENHNLMDLVQKVSGLTTSCNSDTQVLVQPGSIMSDDDTTIINISSSATFDISLGVASNGLDSGSEVNTSWYYIWLFYNPTTNATELRGSTSNSNPTSPTGFTKKAIVGAVYNNSSGNFNRFHTYGSGVDKTYVYETEVLTLSNISVSSRTTVDVDSRVANVGTGYQTCSCTFEMGAGGNLVFYHGDNTASFAFASSSARFVYLSNIQLNSGGEFHLQNNGSAVTGIYMKVLSFIMRLK